MPKVLENFLMQRRFAGLNAYQPAADLADGDVTDSTNLYSYDGEFYSRWGKQACLVTVPSANPNYGMLEFVRTDGTSVLVYVNNAKLYFTVTGTPPLTFTEIKIGGVTSFTLASSGVFLKKAGKYLYVVDGAGSLYRVNIKADGSYTATAVTALNPPNAPAAALTNTSVDTVSDATKWSSFPALSWPNSTTVVNPETINLAANQQFTGGTASPSPYPTGWLDGGDTMGYQAASIGGQEAYFDGGVNPEWADWDYPTPTYPSAANTIASARVWVASAQGHSSGGGAFQMQAFPEDASVSSHTFSTNITGATNVNPIVITAVGHGLVTGQTVTIASVGGNTAANGTWAVTVLSTSTFSIPVAGNGAYTSGGTVTCTGYTSYTDLVIASSGATSTMTSAAHPFVNGDANKVITIFGGTGWTKGNYTLTGVAGGVATVNGNVGINGSTGGVGTLGLDTGGASGDGNYTLQDPTKSPNSGINGAQQSSPVCKGSTSGTKFSQVFSFSSLSQDFNYLKYRLLGAAANSSIGVNSPSLQVVDVRLIPTNLNGLVHLAANNPVGQGANCLGGVWVRRDYTADAGGGRDFSGSNVLTIGYTAPTTTPAGAIQWRFGFQQAGTSISSIVWSNPCSYSADGKSIYCDVSTVSSTVRATTAYLYLKIEQDLPATINPADLCTIGPITAAGNLAVGLGYNYVAVEANDNSVDISGASTGNTTDGVVLSDPSGPSTPNLLTTSYQAQSSLTLKAFVNSTANYVYVYRFNAAGSPNITTYTSYLQLSKCPRWSGGVNGASGWTWSAGTGLWTSTDGYRTWNPSTLAFKDNTPDLSLIGNDFLISGRGAPPTGATAIEVWNNRIVLAKGSTLYISWLLTTDAAAGLYFNTTIDMEDPYASIKGGIYPVEANDNDAIVQLKTHGQYLDVFKQKSVHLLTGLDPTSSFQLTPHLKDAGIGLAGGPRAVCAYDLNVAFVGATGVHEYKADPIHTTFGALQQYELAEQAPIISQKIEPLLAPFLKGGTAIAASAYQKMVLYYHGRRLWLFAPVAGGTSNSVAYVYDTRAATDGSGPVGWTKLTNMNIVSVCSLTGQNDTDDLYMGGDDGQIYKLANNSDVATMVAITGATNASPIVITAAGHGYSNGNKVVITGVGGNTAANGDRYVGGVSGSTFSLYTDSALTVPVAGNGAYSSATGATGLLVGIAWSMKSRGFMNETNDFRFFKQNRPTRAYYVLSTNENANVTFTASVVGAAVTFSLTYGINGQQQDVRFKVPPEIRGYGAVQVALSGTTTTQTRITAVGVQDAKGAIRGNV